MEKETELYLVNKIKDLETQLTFYKGFYDGKFEKAKQFKAEDFVDKPFKAEDFVETYKGYNAELLLKKAQALDFIQEKLGVAVCEWVKEGTYELYCVSPRTTIDKSQFKELWGILHDDN